jgi:hypothetical protein
MCNAWNHPPDCDCGWGGDGHFGGGGGGNSIFRSSYAGQVFEFPFVTFPSYVNPNARCPVCGAAVYFYQSPDGGRVFFDELGPPWPKHPCTDNPVMQHHFSSFEIHTHFPVGATLETGKSDFEVGERTVSAEGEPPSTVAAPPHRTAWVEAGWMPFVVTRIIPRQLGIEAEGKLFVSAGSDSVSFRIVQASDDAQFYRIQGELRIGFSLVQNASPVLSALNECPILLRKDPDFRRLTLSSFILTQDEKVEEIVLSVSGTGCGASFQPELNTIKHTP